MKHKILSVEAVLSAHIGTHTQKQDSCRITCECSESAQEQRIVLCKSDLQQQTNILTTQNLIYTQLKMGSKQT